MADLAVLIRLHKHELDEKRRALGELYSAMAVLEQERRALERAFEQEKETVAAIGDVSFTFASYAEKVRLQRQEQEHHAEELEKHIQAAKDSLMETFSELKKYEMTQEERDRLVEEERAIKESKMMDEIGLETFRRKEDN